MTNPGPRHRKGDSRPFHHDPDERLTFLPAEDQPFRWLPRHGEPSCVGEWLSQHAVKSLSYVPLYTAVVLTLFFIAFVLDK